MEFVGRQGTRYIVKENNQHHLVDLAEQSHKAISAHEVEMIVKHGYWTDDFDEKHRPDIESIIH